MVLDRAIHLLPSSDCIEWPDAKSAGGYGQTWLDGRVQYVHRLALAEHVGREVVGEVRHACDNPPCFNPGHLIEGTHRENAHDMLRRIRQPAVKLDWAKAQQIRELYATGAFSQRRLAAKFEVSQRLIGRVVRGQSWPEEALE